MTTPLSPSNPSHGGQLRHIASRFGIDAQHLLDFSANINPSGPPPSAIAAIQNALADPKTLTTYPDLESTELKLNIANHCVLQPANISIANGFVPLLSAALRALQIERCLLPVPCFSEYRTALENSNAAVSPLPLSPLDHFRYDPAALIAASLQNGCDAILLANPQNPSGVLCPAASMHQLLESAALHNIAVLLDEAFIDYCPEHSLLHTAVNHPRTIVFRSVTKFFAIPGLRVAYAIANPPLTLALGSFLAPWPVTTLAAKAVCAALLDHTFATESRQANRQQRTWLQNELARLNIAAYPSHANFLLLRLPPNHGADRVWERMIVDHRIVLRSCANFEALAPEHLRIAVRTPPENRRLVQGLHQVLLQPA